MKRVILIITVVVLAGCRAAPWPPEPMMDGKDFFVSTSFDPENRLILLSIEAAGQPVCVKPSDWPLVNGGFASSEVLTVHRGDRVFRLREVLVDADIGRIVKIRPYQTLTASVPLEKFDGIDEWTSNDEIDFRPTVTSCFN